MNVALADYADYLEIDPARLFKAIREFTNGAFKDTSPVEFVDLPLWHVRARTSYGQDREYHIELKEYVFPDGARIAFQYADELHTLYIYDERNARGQS